MEAGLTVEAIAEAVVSAEMLVVVEPIAEVEIFAEAVIAEAVAVVVVAFAEAEAVVDTIAMPADQ